ARVALAGGRRKGQQRDNRRRAIARRFLFAKGVFMVPKQGQKTIYIARLDGWVAGFGDTEEEAIEQAVRTFENVVGWNDAYPDAAALRAALVVERAEN